MTTTDSVISDEMRAAIGVESTAGVMEIENTNCRMFARSVGYTDPIFYDEAAAKARGYRGIVAPPGFLGTPIFKPGSGGGAPGETGGRGFAVPYKRILNGGTGATTRVLIESRDNQGNRWFTVGVSPNIVEASFQALLDAINYKLLRDWKVV